MREAILKKTYKNETSMKIDTKFKNFLTLLLWPPLYVFSASLF